VEVISSTFDKPARDHIRIAEMVLEKAKHEYAGQRFVTATTLHRLYKSVCDATSRTLSGAFRLSRCQTASGTNKYTGSGERKNSCTFSSVSSCFTSRPQ